MKKEELRYDPIRENIVKGVQYLNDNSRQVIKILIIIVLVVVVISYYNHIDSVQIESASHLAGKAQNSYINGNLDEALVKFERVLNDYPNTPGALQSMVYLLSDAVYNDELNETSYLLSENHHFLEDQALFL